ncbi:MAG TPA: Hpt domain-containing protein [Burkholderiaceae bacterium]|nr:Hpt domain-containing protein [Burkholderiaceae bacterium]
MTTDFSALPQGARNNFDAGPLSWVMGEIREALTHSKVALSEALTQDFESQATSLRHARAWLHQTHGALQIVDVDGVAIVTETIEDLFDRLISGQLVLTTDIAQTIQNGCQALVEYLEGLLSGEPHQPVRLFPYYKALLGVRGAERVHPADLFFPDLTIRPQLPVRQETSSPVDYDVLRVRFEKILLPFLKNSDSDGDPRNAIAMANIIAQVENAQNGQQAHGFWWVMHAFSEAVASGQIASELYVKQLFARINLQLRRLSQGATGITERVLRDALFFLASVEQPSPRTLQVRSAWQLDGLVPHDYGKLRYGQLDLDSLVLAKEKLSQAKNIWSRIAGGDSGSATAFELEMKELTEAGTRLNSVPLSRLLRELNGIARPAAHARPGDGLGLEMATSLLFVENALNNISRLPEDFPARAEALTSRLLSVVAGEVPPDSAQWLNDMSREAQQRQTMTALAGEMLTSLRQVEKALDAYFNDPVDGSVLAPIDQVLHQIEGALTVLDQDDARRAVQHMRAAVRAFASAAVDAEAESGTVAPEVQAQAFRHVAQNVGALSFFIETLQVHSEDAGKRFSFDADEGMFRASLLEKHHAAPARSENELLPPELGDTADSTATTEQELSWHQQHSAGLALSLSMQPHNPELQEELKKSLEHVRDAATLVDHPDANERAQTAIDLLQQPDFAESADTVSGVVNATAVVEPMPAALVTNAMPASSEAVDAELLEIFLLEAEEVLACIKDTVPALRAESHNQDHLTTLRRSFHTLKGSGRMVGLNVFGEAAWSIEQVLNLWLSEGRHGTPALGALLEHAAEVLEAWVFEIKSDGASSRSPQGLADAAGRVRAGGEFKLDEAPELGADVQSGLDAVEILPVAPDETESLATPSAELAAVELEMEIEVPAELQQAEEIQLSDAELAAFGQVPAEDTPAAEPALLQQAQEPEVGTVLPFTGGPAAATAYDDGIKRIGDLEISVPLHNIYLAEADQLVRQLSNDFAEWRHEPQRRVVIESVHAAHSLAGSSATVGFTPLQEVAHALELILLRLSRQPVVLAAAQFDSLEDCVACVRQMLQQFALGDMPAHEPGKVAFLDQMLREVTAQGELSETPPDVIEEVPDLPSTPEAPAENGGAMVPRLPAVEELPAAGHPDQEALDPALVLKDDLDADLLPVFIEEGRDLLPQMGRALRLWQQNPADASVAAPILRFLHTLKGSARMAGAMGLGQHLHEMETRIEQITYADVATTAALDDLLARHDYGLHLFETLQNPQWASQVSLQDVQTDTLGSQPVVLPQLMPAATSALGTLRPAPGSSPTVAVLAMPLVRVRADILDRLVNQAGEVSISRSRLETEVGTLQQSLSELTENVDRLRSQLREIEMQAETQIASRMTQSGDREFDPLEFDRFTRLQELTRMMAESVNDVASVQQNLARTVEGANTGLDLQARLTRDLQQDLMRVRMVQFASISERLYRVTRQASKEVDKRVSLDIRGSAVEVDRSVLEKMAGPFEHLLRNAIVHGIESREARRAAGKSETGELRVEIRQEGNEVVIQFSDDGHGLDLSRIRDKAQAVGLLSDARDVSDAEVTDLIFNPGFSTASEVTELAGRGIGMDVVRSEAASLGGRIEVNSQPGNGAQFTVHLPLTLAVTQVVLLSTGGKSYAVPSVLVEQVQQLKANALASAYNDGAVIWQGARVPLHYLSALLGDTSATPVSQQYSPLLILKSGNERVAIHVDEIVGNREVVVKNIGPQLARLIGIAGATVLGSGEIVMILNPVPLALRAAHESARAPRMVPADDSHSMGAVAEMSPAAPVSQPVAGLRTQNIVMVVDDSLTVRRVTQRLLSREGFQVVLAKDGVDALQQLQAITPDVMLVDIEMPRMDGFDLTRNVRSDERTRHIPIIMVTSRTAAKHRNYALELGVNEYLGKPYREEDLLAAINGFIQTRTSLV